MLSWLSSAVLSFDPAGVTGLGLNLDPIIVGIQDSEFFVLLQPVQYRAVRAGAGSQVERICCDRAGYGSWGGGGRSLAWGGLSRPFQVDLHRRSCRLHRSRLIAGYWRCGERASQRKHRQE